MCTSKCQGICISSLKDNSCDLKSSLSDEQNSMSQSEQFAHENKTWEKSLDFFKQENTFLKNRLSVVVDNKDSKDFIVLAEYFQNQFILKDEFIKELKKDVIDLGKYIKDNFDNADLTNRILKKQDKLRNEISFFGKDFAALKQEFNKSITQIV